MTTERELIEAAAMQAGYGPGVWTNGGEPYSGGPGLILADGRLWNSLLSPGQCFDLQLRCRISVLLERLSWRCRGTVGAEAYEIRQSLIGAISPLDAEAIRRAITTIAYEQWGANQ